MFRCVCSMYVLQFGISGFLSHNGLINPNRFCSDAKSVPLLRHGPMMIASCKLAARPWPDNAQLYVNTIGCWRQIRSNPDRVSRTIRTKPDVIVRVAKFGGTISGLSLISFTYNRILVTCRECKNFIQKITKDSMYRYFQN